MASYINMPVEYASILCFTVAVFVGINNFSHFDPEKPNILLFGSY